MVDKDTFSFIGYSDNHLRLLLEQGIVTIQDDIITFISKEAYLNVFLTSLKCESIYSLKIIDMCNDNYLKALFNMYYYLYNNDIENGKKYINILLNYNTKDSFINNIDIIVNYKNEDLLFENSDIDIINYFNSLIIKYYKNGMFDICCLIFDELVRINPSANNIIYKNVFNSLKFKTSFIIDTDQDLDDVTYEGIHKIERMLLYYLETFDTKNASVNLMKLKYISNNTLPYDIISLLLVILRKYMDNSKLLSNPNFNNHLGDFRVVFINLLKANDIYRANALLNDIYESNKNSIEYSMYKCILDRIIKVLKRNEEYVNRQVNSMITKNNEQDVLSNVGMSKIDIEVLKNSEDMLLDIDSSKNYYQLYRELFNRKEYESAKKCLLMFKKNMKMMSINKDVDYLLKELDVYILNEDNTERNKRNYNSFIDKALELLEAHNYRDAIIFFSEATKYSKVVNPTDLSRIGYCYYALNNYEKAYEYFVRAEKEYVYPDVYIKLAEISLSLGKYTEVLDYISKYNYYYPEENSYVYYLQSIAYIHLGEYEYARDSIGTVEAINCEINNIFYILDYERSIIDKLENDENVEPYTSKSYISFDLTNDELFMKKEVEKLKEQYQDNFTNYIVSLFKDGKDIENKLDYLLSVIKILNIDEEDLMVLNLITFVDNNIDFFDISDDKKSKLMSTLDYYKGNYIYI